jgi:hypothetical protein
MPFFLKSLEYLRSCQSTSAASKAQSLRRTHSAFRRGDLLSDPWRMCVGVEIGVVAVAVGKSKSRN